jgi:hypothetical protein
VDGDGDMVRPQHCRCRSRCRYGMSLSLWDVAVAMGCRCRCHCRCQNVPGFVCGLNGVQDLLVTSSGATAASSLWLNDGLAVFTPSNVTFGPGVMAAVLVDANGNGVLDVPAAGVLDPYPLLPGTPLQPAILLVHAPFQSVHGCLGRDVSSIKYPRFSCVTVSTLCPVDPQGGRWFPFD